MKLAWISTVLPSPKPRDTSNGAYSFQAAGACYYMHMLFKGVWPHEGAIGTHMPGKVLSLPPPGPKSSLVEIARERASDQLGEVRCGRAIEKCGLRNVPPPSRRSWLRDLTEEGIHPHPRPSGPSFHCVSLNVNGAERAWKAAQHYMQQKVDFLCLHKVKLTPEKANSFMCMAHKHKYYSMFVLSWGREKRMHRAEIFGQVESLCLCLFAIRPGWRQHGGAQKPSLYVSMRVMCSWFVFMCTQTVETLRKFGTICMMA